MRDVCKEVYALTPDGGAIYFMQREKNSEFVLRCLRESGWTFQNLIVWKKKTSAVPAMEALWQTLPNHRVWDERKNSKTIQPAED